jgi:hypothetical protein
MADWNKNPISHLSWVGGELNLRTRLPKTQPTPGHLYSQLATMAKELKSRIKFPLVSAGKAGLSMEYS